MKCVSICCFLLILWGDSVKTYEAGLFNAALNESTLQSSLWYPHYSYYAVNGNKSQNIDSCASTNDDNSTIHWWTVDLGEEYVVHRVVIYNRDQSGHILGNLTIHGVNYMNTSADTSCATYLGPGINRGIVHLNCSTIARYITVEKNATGITGKTDKKLVLCEVEVVADCSDGMFGVNCSQICSPHCKDNITCDKETGECYNGCQAGYNGTQCKHECPDTTHGDNCALTCSQKCKNTLCDKFSNDMICTGGCITGYVGTNCTSECPDTIHGDNCAGSCSVNCKHTMCDKFTNDMICIYGCEAGYNGTSCIEVCPNGTHGENCVSECSSNCRDRLCDKYSNDTVCMSGCITGYIGTDCGAECVDTRHGDNCSLSCDVKCKHQMCDKFTNDMICLYGCVAGYNGTDCSTVCPDGTHGENCVSECSSNCRDRLCDKYSNDTVCMSGCITGYIGTDCGAECVDTQHGDNCSLNCDVNCKHQMCDKFTNDMICLYGCVAGYNGTDCSSECMDGNYGDNCAGTCSEFCVEHCVKQSTNGTCYGNCVEGYTGYDCTDKLGGNNDSTTVVVVCSVLLIVLLAAAIVGVIIIRKRKYRSSTKESERVEYHDTGTMDSFDPPVDDVTVSSPVYNNINTPESDCKSETTTIPNKEIRKYVIKMKGNPWDVRAEYLSLPNGVHPWTEAVLEQNIAKNRYKNIMPYDVTRVVLQKINDDEFSDYINASFIKDYHGNQVYIAGSGPTKVTLRDFWRMIWEYNVNMVVMVTNLVEQAMVKCEKYWPSDGTELNVNGLNITAIKETITNYCTVRTFQMTKDNMSKSVRQYQFTAWPDKKVPENLSALCELRNMMKEEREKQQGPILVHCSAGVGRTGTIIAFDILQEEAEAKRNIDIYNCVKHLREQRTHMVQTQAQYVFLHDAMNEVLTVGSTRISCDKFHHFLSSEEGKKAMITQYEFLEENKPVFKDEEFELGKFEYKHKNRDPEVIAADEKRVILASCPEMYINAVYIKGYIRRREYCATQLPLPDTVTDFWKMIQEERCSTVVYLQTDPDSNQWLPREKNGISWDTGHVTRRDTEKSIDDGSSVIDGTSFIDLTVSPNIVYENLQANANTGDENLQCRVFVVNNWDDIHLKQTDDVRQIIGQVKEWSEQQENQCVTVMCRNGASQCGSYIAGSWLLNMSKAENYIDVFQVVKEIRKTRPQFITSFDQYQFLHELVDNRRSCMEMVI